MAEQRTITRIEPDTMALRALAHPVRMRMLGLLRLEGPATATGLAERLGLNSGATSYHLRQLARHGFIAEDETRGNGRDRWWKAAHESTVTTTVGDDEDAVDAAIAFSQAALNWQVAQMQRALERHGQLPPAWRAASTASDFSIPLNVDQAQALTDRLMAVLWEAKQAAPALGGNYPDGVEPVTYVLHAFPHPPEGDAP